MRCSRSTFRWLTADSVPGQPCGPLTRRRHGGTRMLVLAVLAGVPGAYACVSVRDGTSLARPAHAVALSDGGLDGATRSFVPSLEHTRRAE